jgi:hypothetical protein
MKHDRRKSASSSRKGEDVAEAVDGRSERSPDEEEKVRSDDSTSKDSSSLRPSTVSHLGKGVGSILVGAPTVA